MLLPAQLRRKDLGDVMHKNPTGKDLKNGIGGALATLRCIFVRSLQSLALKPGGLFRQLVQDPYDSPSKSTGSSTYPEGLLFSKYVSGTLNAD